MRPNHRRAIALVLILAVLAGCRYWRTADLDPRTLVETKQPSRVRVSVSDGDRVEIPFPHIAGDSILGERSGQLVGVALADVTRTETRRTSIAATLAITAGVVGTLLLLIGQDSGTLGRFPSLP